MKETTPSTVLPLGYRMPLLVLPWGFVAVVILVFANLVWPRAAEGHVLAIILAVFLFGVILSAVAAAVVFSRDLLTGRYVPGTSRER